MPDPIADHASTEPAGNLSTHNEFAGVTGLAAATLVSGVIGMLACLPLGLAGIVMGFLTLRRAPRTAAREARGMAKLGMACGFASILTSVYYVSVFQSYRDSTRRTACAANLVAINLALTIYGADSNAVGPPSLAQLVELGLLDARFSRCPADTGRAESYVVLKVRPDRPFASQVAAYEPKSHHGSGGHLLFGDGRVAFLRGMEFDQWLAAALRGQASDSP